MGTNGSIKRVNTGRQFEVDFVKFLAIPFMILVHAYEQFGAFDHEHIFPDTVFRHVIEFLGGPPVAPVFMFCMGIGMIYTKHNSPSDFVRRGLKLLLAGYLLNFFRQTLPQFIGIMIGVGEGLDPIGGLFMVDIFQFAGMAFLTVALMKKAKISTFTICAIAFLMQAAGIWTTKINFEPGILPNLLGLIIPTGTLSPFPVALWLVYPAMGMVFGEYLQKCEDKKKMYTKLLAISLVIFASLTSSCLYSGIDIRNMFVLYEDLYYHTSIIGTLWTMCIVMSLFAISYLALRKLEETKAGTFVRYCSSNINTIYFIQWLVISYTLSVLMVLDIEKTTSPLLIILWFVFSAVVTILISIPVVRIMKRIKNKKSTAAG